MQTLRFEPRRGATVRRTLGVQRSRTWLAAGLFAGGMACAATAVTGALSGGAAMGWCLATPSGTWLSMAGHCPWCYGALALVAAAAAVCPDRICSTVRSGLQAPNR